MQPAPSSPEGKQLIAELVDACCADKQRPDFLYWTTFGRVRRGCGHVHDTPYLAAVCLQKDRRACGKKRGHSDRSIQGADNPSLLPGVTTWAISAALSRAKARSTT